MRIKKASCFYINKKRMIGILDSELDQNNIRIDKDDIDNFGSLNKTSKEQFAT